MLSWIVGYLSAAVLFFGVDMVWLGVMASRFYRPILGDIAISGVNLPPAIAFYLLYPIGLLIFAIIPAMRTGSVATAALYGALFGFFTYGTYNLTNFATLRNWSLQLTLVDIAWGSVLAAIVASISYLAVTRFT
jgi:uncharacterized membrane protein